MEFFLGPFYSCVVFMVWMYHSLFSHSPVCGHSFPVLSSYKQIDVVNNFWHTGFPDGSVGRESTWNVGDLGSIPGLKENPLEKEMAIHSSILAWRIPWTVYSMGSQRVGHNWVTCTILHIYTYIHIYIYSFSYSFPLWFATGYWI